MWRFPWRLGLRLSLDIIILVTYFFAMKASKLDQFFVKAISNKEREVHLNSTYTIDRDHKYY